MDVLVIGGNRFVGQLVVYRLLAGGHRVTLFNRGRLPDPFGPLVARLRGDRTTDLARLTSGSRWDACVDLAAFTGPDGRGAVEALRGRVGHYLLVSTGQVYLVRRGCPVPAREADYDGALLERPAGEPDLAEWEYGIGKRECEDALQAAHARDGFPATRVRIPMVNGEGDYYRRVERYLLRMIDGGPVLVPDGGTHRTRHVYGAEVARFLCAILGRQETFGQAYNLAQQETPTLIGLLEALRAQLGSNAPLVPVPRASLLDAGLVPVVLSPFSGSWMSFIDPTRAQRELGFVHEPVWAGLSRVVAHFLARGPSDPPEGYSAGSRALERRVAG